MWGTFATCPFRFIGHVANVPHGKTRHFIVSREAAVALRKQQIGDCLREGNYDAAQFHYGWLIHDIVTSKPAAEIGK